MCGGVAGSVCGASLTAHRHRDLPASGARRGRVESPRDVPVPSGLPHRAHLHRRRRGPRGDAPRARQPPATARGQARKRRSRTRAASTRWATAGRRARCGTTSSPCSSSCSTSRPSSSSRGPRSSSCTARFGLMEMFVFIFILALGLLYVWRKGVLRWA